MSDLMIRRFSPSRLTLIITFFAALAALVSFGVAHAASDLEVKGFTASVSGTTVTYNISVVNNDSAAVTTNIAFFVNQPGAPTCGATPDGEGPVTIAGGTALSLSFGAPLPAGSYSTHVFIDSKCLIAESDELNNVGTANYTVGPVKDLAIRKIGLVTQAEEGLSLPVSFEIENKGNVFESASVELKDNDVVKSSMIGPLLPFGRFTTEFVYDTPSPAGLDHTITISAVPVPGEINTTDNSKPAVISIVPPGAASGDFAWGDLNGDGIQDGGEPGIPDVQVDLERSGSGIVATAFTDFTGKYVVTGLTPMITLPTSSSPWVSDLRLGMLA